MALALTLGSIVRVTNSYFGYSFERIKEMRVKKRQAKKKDKTPGHDASPNAALVRSVDTNPDNITISEDSTQIHKEISSQKIVKFIVYIHEFDKFDESGNQKCRNHNCIQSVCKPFKKYCSRKCSSQFTKWYNANFYWRNIRNQVLKRDKYTCQICGIVLNKKKRYNKQLKNWLECDHIIPKSYYYHLGYQFDTLDNKVKTILEFVHNGNNLRTLCYNCHKKLSVNVASNKSRLLNLEEEID